MQQIEPFFLHGAELRVQGPQNVSGRGAPPDGSAGAPVGGGKDHAH
jgi:hypothetical protein